MLKKLIKYEWKSVSFLLLILHVGLLVYSLVGNIGIQIFLSGVKRVDEMPKIMSILGIFYIIIYVIGIIAIMIATFFYLVKRIQINLFSDEGYLTHTLPVTPTQILTSKVLVFWGWMAIDFLCVTASFLILMTNKDSLPQIGQGFRLVWQALSTADGSILISGILMIAAGLAQYMLYDTGLLFFSICLGNLFKNHKTLGAIASFFGIKILTSMVTTGILLMVTPTNGFFGVIVNQSNGNYGNLFFIVSLIWYTILGIGFFFGSKYILTNKLNLE